MKRSPVWLPATCGCLLCERSPLPLVNTSRFLQTDPIPGGSANRYDYADQDPVNNLDLAGSQVDPPGPSGPAGTGPGRKSLDRRDYVPTRWVLITREVMYQSGWFNAVNYGYYTSQARLRAVRGVYMRVWRSKKTGRIAGWEFKAVVQDQIQTRNEWFGFVHNSYSPWEALSSDTPQTWWRYPR